MIEELVRDGTARFEYQHILNHGPPSVHAALATECGGDQDRWWQFHDHYMRTRDFSRDGALSVAAAEGLDVELFATCLDEQVHLDAINAQHGRALEAGVRRTPTIRINGSGAAITAEALIEQVRALAGES